MDIETWAKGKESGAIPWVAIIEAILAMLDNCENQSSRRIAKRFDDINPVISRSDRLLRIRTQYRLARELRRSCPCSYAESKDSAEDIVSDLFSSDESEILTGIQAVRGEIVIAAGDDSE